MLHAQPSIATCASSTPGRGSPDVPVPHTSGQLIVEVTETAVIKNIECARSLARQLRSLGCKLALDDLGVGFASFRYLKLITSTI